MPLFESVTTAYFIGYKCPLTKCSNNTISIRAKTNKLEQKGTVIKNIVPVPGIYNIQIKVNTIGCSIYWYGTYDDYKILQLVQGINTFNIEIKQTQKNAFDVGIMTSNLIFGKYFDVVEIRVSKAATGSTNSDPIQSVNIQNQAFLPTAPKQTIPKISKSTIVSVILPTLNRVDGFKKVIDNFRYQSFPNFELIAIDDGSEQNIFNEKKQYIDSLNDGKFKIIRNANNIGTASSLNKGILNSVGQYITWVSDDNEYYNNYLKHLYNPSYDFIYSYWDYMDNFRKTKVIVKAEYNLESLLSNFKGLGAFMWKKSFMDKIGYYDDTIRGCEDYDYLLRTFNNTDKIFLNKVSTMKYVYHSNCVFYKNFDGIIEIKHNIADIYRNIIKYNTMSEINIFISSIQPNVFIEKYKKYLNNLHANILLVQNNNIVHYNGYKLVTIPTKYQLVVANFSRHKKVNLYYTDDVSSKNHIEVFKKMVNINKIEHMVENKIITVDKKPVAIEQKTPQIPHSTNGKSVAIEKKTPQIAPIIPHSTNGKSIIFLHVDADGAGTWWYKNVNSIYQKILRSKFYNVKVINLKSKGFDLEKNSLNELYLARNNDLYILNPINFASFLVTLKHFPTMRNKLYNFIKNIKYIAIWQEIFNDDLSIIGYQEDYIDKDFILTYFRNSKMNLVSNLISIKILEKFGITNNKYFIITGYSEINNIVPFNSNDVPFIDILIYGDLASSYTYRNNIINLIKQKNKQNLNICIIDNVFGDKLDRYLKKAKIVIHIPSYANLNHMPWPKITTLQCKKVFFIVEENEELFEKNLENIISYYKRNDIDDIYSKVEYYLKNPEIRKNMIEANYNFIKNNYNIDNVIPSLIEQFV